jgi:hypothetical protein
MTVNDLIKRLLDFDPEARVVARDSEGVRLEVVESDVSETAILYGDRPCVQITPSW